MKIFFSTAFFVFFSCFSPFPQVKKEEPSQKQAPAPVEIALIHWNDFHSANNPKKWNLKEDGSFMVGGAAYLAGYVDSLRGLYPRHLVLHAGDEFQGTPISSLTKGKSQLVLLNTILPDAFTLGNHEFDYGMESIREWIKGAKFPIVSANLFDENTGKSFVAPYILRRFENVDVAVIGMMSPDLKTLTVPEATKGLRLLDDIQEAERLVAALKDTAELIIVLSHMGVYEDSVLAANVKDIDYIVGGHSHTVLEQPFSVNGVKILQAGSHGRYVGLLLLKIDAAGNLFQEEYNLILTDNRGIKPNKLVAHLVDSLNQIEGKSMDEVIGTLVTPWERSRQGESNLGDWLCDAMRDEFKCDIAIQNNGGIRKDLPAGEIRVRDIWEISPFGNHFVIFRLNGKQVRQFLEYQISRRGISIQISGLRFTYNSAEKQLISVEVNGEPLDPDRSYSIVTNNYVFGQFKKYFGFIPGDISFTDTGVIDRDLFLKAVEKQGRIDSQPDGRIKDVAMP